MELSEKIKKLIREGQDLLCTEPEETLREKIDVVIAAVNPLLEQYFLAKNKKIGVNRKVFQITSFRDFGRFRML